MAKLFRKGRFNFFQGKGMGQYLLYILLEMVLVVAGILIALEINNANEVRKEQEKTTILLSQVERDLRINLKQLEDIQETLEQRDSIMAILLKGELTWEEFKANPVHSVLIASYSTFNFKDQGYQNIVRYGDYFGHEYDTLIPSLEELYNEDYDRLIEINQRVSNFAINTLELWTDQFSWFRKIGTPMLPDEAKAYYLDGPFYLNRVQTYRTYSTMNLLSMVRVARLATVQAIVDIVEKVRPTENPYIDFEDYLMPFRAADWQGDTGYYQLGSYYALHCYIQENKLFIKAKAQNAVQLFPRNDSTLFAPLLGSTVRFDRVNKTMDIHGPGGTQTLKKR